MSIPENSVRARRVIEQTASCWVVRRRAGLDAAGEAEFERWLAADAAHAAAFARLAAIAGALDRARERGATGGMLAQLRGRARRRRVRRCTWAAAASLVVALAVGGWWRRSDLRDAPREAGSARVAEPLRRLSDGSIVELNRDAAIEVRYDTSTRRVALIRGEALFRVEKDPARPFVVEAHGLEVRAVGTAFSVRLEESSLAVLVTEGKVGVENPREGVSLLPPRAAAGPAVLTPGEHALIDLRRSGEAGGAVRITTLDADAMRERLAWRVPRLELDSVTLAEAVARMNGQSRERIALGDEALGRLRISGTFVADDPQTFARLAAATFNLQVRRDPDGRIVLSAAPRD